MISASAAPASAHHTIGYRPDIDGLRALAVTLVILVHAFPNQMRNGFIGVDIFFVISGFLITGILLTQLKGDTFSLRDFYIRRANRIFPALILVLIACIGFGWVSLYASEFKLLGRSVATGAGFIANIGYFLETGYWDISAKLKPLLHLWSLGVEEQYYLVWPVLLWAAWTRRFNVAILFALLISASLAWNLWSIRIDQAATFYLPFSRFWELSAGGALAYVGVVRPAARLNASALVNALQRLVFRPMQRLAPGLLSNVLAFVGLTLIVAALVERYSLEKYPGEHAILPGLGAVLIIAAGSKAWLNAKLLSHRLAVYAGLISFPLYLWHWPLLTFARILGNGELPDTFRNLALLLTILLAVATYHLLEKPIRINRNRRGLTAVLLCVLLAVCGMAGYSVYANDGFGARYAKSESWIPPARPAIPGTSKVVLLGDSNAAVLFPGLRSVYKERLDIIATQGWPHLAGLNFRPGVKPTDPLTTPQVTDQALARIVSDQAIEAVIISHMSVQYIQQDDYRSYPVSLPGETSTMAYESALRRTVKLLTDAGKMVIYVRSIPFLYGVASVEACSPSPLRIPRKQPDACISSLPVIQERLRAYDNAVGRALQGLSRVSVFDTLKYLCDEIYCYVQKDGIPMYRDISHLSEAGSYVVGFGLAEFVETQRTRIGGSSTRLP